MRARPGPMPDALALCLSGGGLRASLFHAGAVRRLAETGALARTDALSAVSGGAIFAAFLVERLAPWPSGPLAPEAYEGAVAGPFRREVAAANLRRGLLGGRLRGRPFVESMARVYAEVLTRKRLAELPERPRLVLNATDLAFGANWVFERDRVGSYKAGYLRADLRREWTVARAVAASSCFPPVFRPMKLRLRPGDLTRGERRDDPDYTQVVRNIRLADGGVYGNQGIVPVQRADAVIVSNGGAPIPERPLRGLVSEVMRYFSVPAAQVERLEKEDLLGRVRAGSARGAYWGIRWSAPGSFGGCPGGAEVDLAGYPQGLVLNHIERIRTDLDAFSEGEAKILENHGYALAEASLRCFAPDLTGSGAPFGLPHPEWADAARAESHLTERKSHKRRLLGRSR